MGYRVVKMTPKLAEAYLEKNTHNRKSTASHVAFLTDLMLKGEWRLTGEPIRFFGKLRAKNIPADDAVLLDGQHRLTAFLNSGLKSLDFEVIDELPADSFEFMDQGRPRNAGDVLSIEGYKNVNVLAGVARTLYNYELGGISGYWKSTQGGKRKATNHEILQYVRANETGLEKAIAEATKYMSKISMSLSVHGACYYLFRKRSVTDCEKFFYMLSEGEKLAKTNPVYHLRSILIDHRFSRKRAKQMGIHSKHLFIMEVITWNLFREGKKIADRKQIINFDIENLPKTIK